MELKSTGNLKAEFVLTENETRLTSFIDNFDCREELTVPEGYEKSEEVRQSINALKGDK